MKQILLTMNEKQSFIIEDLDDHHVVIKADEEWRVRRELEAEVSPTSSEARLQSCLYHTHPNDIISFWQLEKNTYSLE